MRATTLDEQHFHFDISAAWHMIHKTVHDVFLCSNEQFIRKKKRMSEEEKKKKAKYIYAICFYYGRAIRWCQLNHRKYSAQKKTEKKKITRKENTLPHSVSSPDALDDVNSNDFCLQFALPWCLLLEYQLIVYRICYTPNTSGCSMFSNQFNWPSKLSNQI